MIFFRFLMLYYIIVFVSTLTWISVDLSAKCFKYLFFSFGFVVALSIFGCEHIFFRSFLNKLINDFGLYALCISCCDPAFSVVLVLGAQIIDLMMLVVDVAKGLQTQTAECLVIGELTCRRMVVVLNKTDLLPENKRQSAIDKMTKRLHKTLENTRSTSRFHCNWPGLTPPATS